MRLTYRTARVLEGVAEQPGASNRMVADYAGVIDPGQISKLLARLERARAAREHGRGPRQGRAERLDAHPKGEQVARSIRVHSPNQREAA